MKLTLLTLTLFISFFAQAQFDTAMVVDTTIYGSSVSDIEIVDMNKDGYNDLVISDNGGLGRVSIYLNDSSGGFGNETIISSIKYQYMAIAIGDFNKDGRMDVMAITKTGKITQLLQTKLGTYTQTDIYSRVFFPLDIITADLNQDGYLDFVSVGDRSILAFINGRNGSFDTSNVSSNTEYYCMAVGDLNADGYPDLLSGSGGFLTFINDSTGILVRNTMNESVKVPTQIHECELADMDGDGDLDVVVYYTNTYDKVDWYSNDGSGKLTKETTITSLANNVFDINLGDIDLDGKVDIVLGYDQVKKLVWIKNEGKGIFSSEKSINSNVSSPYYAELGDIDNDGDLDLCHSANDGLFYYTNNTPSTLSVKESAKIDITWYPNPSRGRITIESPIPFELKIFDMLGTLVYENHFPSGDQNIEPKLPNGNYIIEVQNARGIKRSKMTLLN